jgi:hypothetical protein
LKEAVWRIIISKFLNESFLKACGEEIEGCEQLATYYYFFVPFSLNNSPIHFSLERSLQLSNGGCEGKH